MSQHRPARRRRTRQTDSPIRFTAAAITGVLAGLTRAVATWLIDHFTAGH